MKRQPKLKLFRAVWLTRESHKQLRDLKKLHKKSMAEIVIDLIKKEHEKKN